MRAQIALYYRKLEYPIKIVISCLIFSYLFYVIHSKIKFEELFTFNLNTRSNFIWLWLIVFVLMFVNWGFEALKWKFLVKREINYSFFKAYSEILQSLMFGFVTPARAGDIGYRMVSVKGAEQKLFYAVMINRSTQFIVTVGIGLISMFLLYPVLQDMSLNFDQWYLVVILLAFLVIAVYLIFKLKRIKDYWHQYKNYYSLQELGYVLMLSFGRYTIFMIQYVMVCYIFRFELSVDVLFGAVGLTFLLKSIVPFLNVFGELGLRETAALVVFSSGLMIDGKIVLASSLSVWCINILMPVIIGYAIFVFRNVYGAR